MKIVVSVIYLSGLWNVFGASIKELGNEYKMDNSTEKVNSVESTKIWRSPDQSTEPPKWDVESKNGTRLPPNLIQKIISTLRRKPSAAQSDPNKQLFGGRLPPFIERIIQRIQNYFSVYNPPEYFDSNRPPPSQNEGITIICANSANDSLSCNEMNETDEENVETCETNSVETSDPCANGQNSPECAETSSQNPQDEYNVVVTHTVVQDSQLNVYSPVDSMHMVSNVVVILEPSAAEYTPPVETTTRNKFYVYVNPTGNKNQLKSAGEGTEKPEPFQPYVNTTYTVIIRGDKLEEYSNNIENSDNNSLNPDIAIYVKNSTNSGKRCKPHPQKADCNQKAKNTDVSDEQVVVSSRSVSGEEKNDNKVPNINLMLVPPDNGKKNNKTCSKNKITNNNANIEYYILKPDNGNKIKQQKENTFYLQKTNINNIAQTYLPPNDDNEGTTENVNSSTMETKNDQTSPLIINLYEKKEEQVKS